MFFEYCDFWAKRLNAWMFPHTNIRCHVRCNFRFNFSCTFRYQVRCPASCHIRSYMMYFQLSCQLSCLMLCLISCPMLCPRTKSLGHLGRWKISPEASARLLGWQIFERVFSLLVNHYSAVSPYFNGTSLKKSYVCETIHVKSLFLKNL